MRIPSPIKLLLLGCLAGSWVLGQGPTQPPGASQIPGKGVGDLTILPTRVVLEGRVRAGEVLLKNAGKETATYRIFLQEMEMTPEGRLQGRTKGPGELTAADVVRFSPHQVDLAPGEAQVVRIQVRKPENLPAGEYRSHMVFQGIPPVEAPVSTDPAAETKGLSISIKPVYGISIPIIVRHGETQASLKLANLAFHGVPSDQYLPALTLDILRQGNRSVMGDIEVVVVSGGPLKKGTVVGTNKGVAVYSNLPTRNVTMPLMPGKGVDLKGSRLMVTFTSRDPKGAPIQALLDIP